MSKGTLIAFCALVVTIFVSVGFLFSTGVWNWPLKKQNAQKPMQKEEPKMTVLDANTLALNEAQKWQPNAKLALISSLKGTTGSYGTSDNWELIFTSSSTQKEMLRVVIANGQIRSTATTTPFAVKGKDLPQNLISSQEAIETFHGIKGYENASVISVELIYEKIWSWRIITKINNKETSITISAER